MPTILADGVIGDEGVRFAIGEARADFAIAAVLPADDLHLDPAPVETLQHATGLNHGVVRVVRFI